MKHAVCAFFNAVDWWGSNLLHYSSMSGEVAEEENRKPYNLAIIAIRLMLPTNIVTCIPSIMSIAAFSYSTSLHAPEEVSYQKDAREGESREPAFTMLSRSILSGLPHSGLIATGRAFAFRNLIVLATLFHWHGKAIRPSVGIPFFGEQCNRSL